MVAAALTLRLMGTAVTYSFGRYCEPLSREFGTDRGAIALVFAITALPGYALAALTGPTADRFGPRRICGLEALAFVAGVMLVWLVLPVHRCPLGQYRGYDHLAAPRRRAV